MKMRELGQASAHSDRPIAKRSYFDRSRRILIVSSRYLFRYTLRPSFVLSCGPQFRYWPWLIRRSGEAIIAVKHSRAARSWLRESRNLSWANWLARQAGDVRPEILRRISGLDSTPIKIKLALTTPNVLQISLLPSCLHARSARHRTIHPPTYTGIRTTHTYIHTQYNTHLLWCMLFDASYLVPKYNASRAFASAPCRSA